MPGHIPETLPVDPLDRPMMWFETISALMIQLELKFDGQLDQNRLARAAWLTVDAEPVLGCRLVHHWRNPCWKRIEAKLEDVFETAASPEEYEAFLQKTLDPYKGPQIRTSLWNDSAGARLLIKVAHHAADAAGVKDVCRVMGSIYNQLDQDPGYRPEPNLSRPENGIKLYGLVPKNERTALKRQYNEYIKQGHVGEGTFRLPFDREPADSGFFYTNRTLAPDQVASMVKYGGSRQATLNDLMVAAMFRAQVSAGGWKGNGQLRVSTTIDLRRHLPERRATAVANLSLSLGAWPNLGLDLGTNFSDTLQKVTAATRKRKDKYFGLDMLVFVWPLLTTIPHALAIRGVRRSLDREHRSNNLADAFTNMGAIDPNDVTFDAKPVEAVLLPPAGFPPFFLMGASGYDGALNLSITGYGVKKDVMENFLDDMVKELAV